MTKGKKKTNRRLKKTVRKTLGTLFLISAIIVAAIPTEGLRAADGTEKEVTESYLQQMKIPYLDSKEEIYTTGDGKYQFAYVTDGGSDKGAVILGYNGGYLEGNNLVIPDGLDAYKKYSYSDGTNGGYVAVGKENDFLFYAVNQTTTDPVTGAEIVISTSYQPCRYEDRAQWENLSSEELYYHKSDTVSGGDLVPVYEKTTDSNKQRIKGAEVWYIGNQYLQEGTGKDAGTWKIAGPITSSDKGIFAGNGNIHTLTIGKSVKGVGVYAFYGCTGMSSISLGNGLNIIGDYAFANCLTMTSVNLDRISNLTTISDYAFANCQSMEKFTVPINVTTIGNNVFEDCYSMIGINMSNAEENNGFSVEEEMASTNNATALNNFGKNVFKGCANLRSVTFPRTFSNANGPVSGSIDVSEFRGCENLKYVTAANPSLKITGGAVDTSYTFDSFKADVPAEFYLESVDSSQFHTCATNNYMAFSYLNSDGTKQNLYELTVQETSGKKAVYRVNSSNQLVYCEFDSGLETVTMPDTVGPYQITVIGSGIFRNNCYLRRITIPSSITTIEDSAFKGCHNLKDVIFKEPVNIISIGTDAFKTQEVEYHKADCGNKDATDVQQLYFTGPISDDSAPFNYAMDPNSYINRGNQERTYITYYSGWPKNLEVKYNPDTDKNELADYPTFKEIQSGSKYTTDNYAYMTLEYQEAAKTAVDKYLGTNSEPMTDYEREIINAALQIELPYGIETIKEGLFTATEASEALPSNTTKTLTAYGLLEIGKETFKGCTNLSGVYLKDRTTKIDDYAFDGCKSLTGVAVPATTTTMGKRPFTGCEKLTTVDFQGSPYFTCDNSIIYSLENGKKKDIIEFLEGRASGVVAPTEVEGVTGIAEEAFAGTKVSSVDLRTSFVTDIPEGAFMDTPKLFAVYLPDTCKSISKDSFTNSSIAYMEVPESVSYLDNDAFGGTTDKSALQFYCVDGSNAYIYATKNGIMTTSKPLELFYTVTFWDWDSTLLDTQTVAAGGDAVPPEVKGREGYTLTGWVPDYHGVQADLQVTAQYEADDPDASKYTVTFLDWDDSVLKTMLVAPGKDAEPPIDPKREGYTFIGWRPAVTNIQANTTIYAQYEKNDSEDSKFTVRFIDYDDTVLYVQKVASGEDAIAPQSPTRSGYTFTGWRPAITGITKDTDTYAQYAITGSQDDPNATATPAPGTTATPAPGTNTTTKLYTLTVKNGSGSGSYAAGSQPIIIANDPAKGMQFSNWTIDPSNTTIASKVLSATVITMPAGNVTVTANYTKSNGSNTSTSTGSGNSTNSNSNRRPNSTTTGNVSGGRTTVVIDKNGLSNTGVVSATVNGSSDNFVIKITESASASEEVVKALMAEYGNDISAIKYFPMDISLYDSTGNNKITDTTGLSISITLPIPDSLITYAGNNKVAGVVNSKLDKLTPKFSTISGVSCITFTAEHFSPYVIYVDTNNLTAGTIADSTPKTGDAIHPKWFLSLGLACLSIVFFMKKDKKTLRKARA